MSNFDTHGTNADYPSLDHAAQADADANIDAELRLRAEGEPILRWFRFGHLPTAEKRAASRPWAQLALHIVLTIPRRGSERTTALRKLLEGKDAGVRAAIEASE